MKLLLKRTAFPDYTSGKLFVDGDYFCDTLEDPNRDLNENGVFDGDEKKVAGDTCIPYGTYKITVDMSPKFKRELPRLLNVSSFTGILIHRGNTTKDTSGCILVGENSTPGTIKNSTKYEVELVKRMKEALKNNETITIEIV